jgi:hypothetical protein
LPINQLERGPWAIALDRYLRGELPADQDAQAAEPSPEVLALADRTGQAWAAAVEAGRTST